MSVLGAIVKFVAKEVASPILREVGEHVGGALGHHVGRRLNPGKYKAGGDAPTELVSSKDDL